MDDLISPLVETLRKTLTMVVRSAPSSGDSLEAVLSRDDLSRCCALLSEAFGPPVKEFDKAAKFDRATQKLVEHMGGIRVEQCLFLKQRENQHTAYAALWPWASDTTRVTLKIGLC